MRCEFCNSEHAPEDYQVGWFVLGDQPDGLSIARVDGEETIHKYGRDNKVQIFWTEQGANDELARRAGPKLTNPITGSLLRDQAGEPVPLAGGKFVFDPDTNEVFPYDG